MTNLITKAAGDCNEIVRPEVSLPIVPPVTGIGPSECTADCACRNCVDQITVNHPVAGYAAYDGMTAHAELFDVIELDADPELLNEALQAVDDELMIESHPFDKVRIFVMAAMVWVTPLVINRECSHHRAMLGLNWIWDRHLFQTLRRQDFDSLVNKILRGEIPRVVPNIWEGVE